MSDNEEVTAEAQWLDFVKSLVDTEESKIVLSFLVDTSITSFPNQVIIKFDALNPTYPCFINDSKYIFAGRTDQEPDFPNIYQYVMTGAESKKFGCMIVQYEDNYIGVVYDVDDKPIARDFFFRCFQGG